MKNLSTALAKFASLFDGFSKKLSTMRSEKSRTIGDPWSRFWGARETSFEEELDTTLLSVLEPYKKILTLLKEVRINRILAEAALTPESKVEQAELFKEKADIKLNELSEEIDILKQRLSMSSSEEENEDKLFESSRFVTSLSLDDTGATGKFTVTEVPFNQKGQDAPGHLDSQAIRSPFSQSLSGSAPDQRNSLGISGASSDSLVSNTATAVKSSIIDKSNLVEELAEIECDIIEMRNYFEDKNDLKIKTPEGVKALSLPFFLSKGLDGSERVILDLEGILEIHNKAIKAVTESWGKSKDIDKTKPLLQIIQNYLLSMYGNMRTKINISSDHMPNTKGAITYDLFLQLEVCTNMGAWETIEDIEAFREIFEETFNKPFHEYVKEPENRLAYLQSIING